MATHSRVLRDALVDCATRVLGPPMFVGLTLARRYANRRQLRQCNQVGTGVITGLDLQVHNEGFIAIADDVEISPRVLLHCYSGGSITIGKDSTVGHNVRIVAGNGRVSIGDHCLIADNVSIRGTNHGMKAGELMRRQPNRAADITIEHDVWIGAGVVVLAGSTIAEGCVVGANSVVLGDTEPNTVYVGSPIRKVRSRNDG